MSSHYRSSSPGGRRIANPARLSEPYYGVSSYSSPRGSTERVIPISSTTFINPPRATDRLDAYSSSTTTRPRRSTLTEQARPSSQHSHPTYVQQQPHARTRPAIVQSHVDRPASPLTRPSRSHNSTHNQEYYVTPAITSTPRREHAHKKVYSIDDGKSHLVADIDINPSKSARRASVDRAGYRSLAAPQPATHRTSYHHAASSAKRPDHVEIDSGFSYTDPAGMYRDTEPRRRPRAGSVEGSRNRPSSMVLDSFPPRTSARELGPPTSRALDRYNDNLGLGSSLHRGGSLRDTPRPVNLPVYQDSPSGYASSQEYHAPSTSKQRHSAAIHQDRTTERRETYPPAREVVLREPYDERSDRSRAARVYEDRSVERRGFGIRNESLERRGTTRGSDENLNRRGSYLDRGSAATQSTDLREVGSPRATRDDARREQERRDYEYAKDMERQDRERIERERIERERTRARDHREPERREKERPSEDQIYPPDRERDRTRSSRDASNYRDHDRDRRDHDRFSTPPKDSGDGLNAVLPAAAIGGLGAAAAYGAAEVAGKTRNRDKDRGHQSPPDSGKEDDRGARHRDQRETRRHDDSPPTRDHRPPTNDKDKPDKERAVSDPQPQAYLDPDEDYRRRLQQAQREIGVVDPSIASRDPPTHDAVADSEYRRRDRAERAERSDRAPYRESGIEDSSPPHAHRRSSDESSMPRASVGTLDRGEGAGAGASRDSRVRIVDPPSQKDEQQPIRGILRRPTEKFPEDPNPIREGVAPLKDASKDKSIPTDARWTKISRELVNPDCLVEAKERFEEREDCVIVLRVLTKEEIQKFADRTAEIRYARFEDADRSRRERRRRDKDHDRRERDEYSEHSEDEYAPRAPRMLEAPASSHDAPGDFVRDRRRDRDRGDREDGAYMSGGGGI